MDKYFVCLDSFLNYPNEKLDKIICEEHMEKQFTTDKGNKYTLHGYCDFLIHNNEKEVTILDGKRNTFVKYDNDDIEHKNPKFAFISQYQLMIYGWLSGKQMKKMAFYDYTLNKIINVPFDKDKYIEDVKSYVDNIIDKIANDKEFIGKPSKQNCRFCQFKPHCDDWVRFENGIIEL